MDMDRRPVMLRPGDALIVVDVQNDFLPGGALAVPHGDEVVPVLNEWARRFHRRGLPVYATRDWHPPDHCSFAIRGGPWPVHCVAGSPGAAYAPGLELPPGTEIISKDVLPEESTYSGFACTDLAERLRRRQVDRVFVGGLATDYCVLNTVRDALKAGFACVLLTDAIRPVEVRPGDGAAAIADMTALGAVTSDLERLQA